MGLLNFKKSRKQGTKPPNEPNPFLLHKLEYSQSMPKPSETSLMDDIMKELDSSNHCDSNQTPMIKRKQFTPLIKFDEPQQIVSEPRTPHSQTVYSDDESLPEKVLRQRHSVPGVNNNKQFMNRMKQRHRQEVRTSDSAEKPRSFIASPVKRPYGPLARSTSAMTNLMPVPMQSGMRGLISSPSLVRNSFTHLPLQDEEWSGSKKFQINRYPQDEQLLQEMKRKQKIQAQIEIQKQQQQIISQQQQQLQQLQQQQQILIGQQQYQQQQQQQQLLLQQQQIQKLQQASLEAAAAQTKPRVRHNHHRNCRHIKQEESKKVEIPTFNPRNSTVMLERLPVKLKRELEDMKMRKSMYSVPDLTRLSKESEKTYCHHFHTCKKHGHRSKYLFVGA